MYLFSSIYIYLKKYVFPINTNNAAKIIKPPPRRTNKIQNSFRSAATLEIRIEISGRRVVLQTEREEKKHT